MLNPDAPCTQTTRQSKSEGFSTEVTIFSTMFGQSVSRSRAEVHPTGEFHCCVCIEKTLLQCLGLSRKPSWSSLKNILELTIYALEQNVCNNILTVCHYNDNSLTCKRLGKQHSVIYTYIESEWLHTIRSIPSKIQYTTYVVPCFTLLLPWHSLNPY